MTAAHGIDWKFLGVMASAMFGFAAMAAIDAGA